MHEIKRRPIPVWVKRAVLGRELFDPDQDTVYCDYCMEEADLTWHGNTPHIGGFEWDHVVPVARGGTNDPENITIACVPCNRSKGAKINWVSEVERIFSVPA